MVLMNGNRSIASKFFCEDEFKMAVVEFIARQVCEKTWGGEAA